MANEITYNFPLKQDAYAAFDAISLRNLIIQRLNDQGLITDQNYLGSNIASIIDIVSYAFNTLIFYLNKTSNESIFTEAQLYENINRIVKLLDYKPVGYQTSVLAFECTTVSQDFLRGVYTIPRYSYISVGSSVFSFNEDITFTITSDNTVNLPLPDISNKVLLYQGAFREYPTQVATGEKNEVVTLNTPDSLVDHFNLDVYVWEKSQGKWIQYKQTQTLYGQQAFSRVFEKRLNSNFLYEITFGDGIAGRKLDQGDKIAIFYLQSAGLNGVVGPNALEGQGGGNRAQAVIYNSALYNEIIQDINQDRYVYLTNSELVGIGFANSVGSTIPKDVESPDSIRKNAPAVFKSQYRLVSQDDYETHIKTNFYNFVSDVKVFSNWDYTSKYLKYFHDLNLNPGGFRQIVLNQVLYADSCNFNNIYICAVPRVSEGSTLKYLLPAQKEAMASTISLIKTITTELTFLDPIYKAVHFGATAPGSTTVIPNANTFYLEIQKHRTSVRSAKAIHMEAATVLKDFFDLTNVKLGARFEYTTLYSKLLSIDGVAKITTKDSSSDTYFEGLSFFVWNPIYSDLDKQTVYNNINLLEFELLYFEGLSTVETKIVVV